MGEVSENNSDMSVLQKIATSGVPLLKDYGLSGVVCAVLLAIVIPLLLTSMFGKKTKKRAVQADVGGEAGLAMRNSRFSSLVQVPWEGATQWQLYSRWPAKSTLDGGVLAQES